MTSLTPLPPETFRRTPWKNGGGTTIDIDGRHASGADAGGWSGVVWRLGRTAITRPAPFSDLSGYERLQLVIEGAGLVLETSDGEIDLRRPLVPVRYDGGTPIVSRLENGPVEVVNLIADRTLCTIDLIVPEPAVPIRLAAGTHVLYAPREDAAGTVAAQSIALAGGHALRIETQAAVDLTLISGLVVLASIQPVPT